MTPLWRPRTSTRTLFVDAQDVSKYVYLAAYKERKGHSGTLPLFGLFFSGLGQGPFYSQLGTARSLKRLKKLFRERSDAGITSGMSKTVVRVLEVAYVDAIREGARHLVGHHDFTTFRSAHCQSASPVKTLDRVDVVQNGAEFRFCLSARSFLHNQVRSIVGTLERVGAGKWLPDDVARVLAAANRSRCGPVAPPDGLYLTKVDY